MKLCVIGGMNVDISGRTDAKLLAGDSNPGHVSVSLGGVGRNIAENLKRLGSEVMLVTAYGNDRNGLWARTECESLGIDMSASAGFPGMSTGTYVCIHDERGELCCAVSDMRVCECVTPEFLRPRLNAINACDAVVIDANLPEESLRFLAENCSVPLAADPVSARKADKLWGILSSLTLLKPNMAEAAVLSGRRVTSDEETQTAASALLGLGVRHVMISMGGRGVWYADAAASGREPTRERRIISTNGCGDAFFSACLVAMLRGMNTPEMARVGQAAAALCAESEAAVSPSMTWQAVLERAR